MWMLSFLPLAFVLLSNAYLFLVRPARQRGKLERLKAAEPEAAPERREPRDTARPYPKPPGTAPDDERLTVCPVCGMEDPLFLDGGPAQEDLMGWPAHRECVEWLGAWKPARPVQEARPVQQAVHGYRYVGGGVVSLGGTAATILAPEWAEALKAGMITIDEFRERVAGAFGYPETAIIPTGPATGTFACDCGMSFSGTVADLGRSMAAHRSSGQHEQRLAYEKRRSAAAASPVSAPLSRMWCTCGKEFIGTAAGIKSVMDAHHASGECPHSARHR